MERKKPIRHKLRNKIYRLTHCKKLVWHGFGSGSCSSKVWTERIEDGFCKRHHPDRVKEREARASTKYDLESECRTASWDLQRLKGKIFDKVLELNPPGFEKELEDYMDLVQKKDEASRKIADFGGSKR